jgi:hypothetical protein
VSAPEVSLTLPPSSIPATVVTPSLQAPQPLVAPPSGLPSVLSVTAHSTNDGFTTNDLLYLFQQQVNIFVYVSVFLIKIFILFSLTVRIEAYKIL